MYRILWQATCVMTECRSSDGLVSAYGYFVWILNELSSVFFFGLSRGSCLGVHDVNPWTILWPVCASSPPKRVCRSLYRFHVFGYVLLYIIYFYVGFLIPAVSIRSPSCEAYNGTECQQNCILKALLPNLLPSSTAAGCSWGLSLDLRNHSITLGIHKRRYWLLLAYSVFNRIQRGKPRNLLGNKLTKSYTILTFTPC